MPRVSIVDDNKELVRRLVRIVNERRFEAIGEVASGQVAEEAARWVGPFAESFPDFRMDVVELIAEHDKVVGYFKCSGTQHGEWRGKAPSGRRFEDIDEIYIFRVRDGRLDSAIAALEDNLTRIRQLDLQP
jgi:predicted ester cyclase